jgi:hypothetical protein
VLGLQSLWPVLRLRGGDRSISASTGPLGAVLAGLACYVLALAVTITDTARPSTVGSVVGNEASRLPPARRFALGC